MGAQQSSEGNGDCHPCFVFGAPFGRKSNSNDPLGSPMPDTPVSRRKRREFSTQYDGLEKEISTVGQSSFYTSNANVSRTADVHEGSVRDMLYSVQETEENSSFAFLANLKEHFSFLNICVSPEQILDFVEIFHLTLMASLLPAKKIICTAVNYRMQR